jgi:hypothetical protein
LRPEFLERFAMWPIVHHVLEGILIVFGAAGVSCMCLGAWAGLAGDSRLRRVQREEMRR